MARRWLRKIMLWSIVVGAVIAIGAWGASEAVIRYCVAPEPPMPKAHPIFSTRLRKDNGRTRFAGSWLARRDGIWMMYVTGDAFARGYSIGMLGRHLHDRLEDDFLGQVADKLSNPLILRAVRTFVALHNCSLHTHIAKEHQMELLGLARAIPPRHTYLGPQYNKFMNYHAAHDISHLVMDTPFLQMSGCTGFAAWGAWTHQGRLLVGRNFDFEAARTFDESKVVFFVKPDRGIPYISVAWMGLLGVVSGINQAGLSITLYAGHSADPKGIGTPIALVARQALQYAKTIDAAKRILCDAKVFVSESFLLVSRQERQAVVIERSPHRCVLRKPESNGRILVANHFLTPAFANDPKTREYRENGTSMPRLARIDTLLQTAKGRLDPAWAVRILRDQRAPNGQDWGVGNRSALNAMLATHSVIFDHDAMRVWVSASPHQVGKFVAFSVMDFAKPLPAQTIPVDLALAADHQMWLRYRRTLRKTKQLIRQRRWQNALPLAHQLQALNGRYYETWWLLGEIALALKQQKQAIHALKQALAAHPAYPSERNTIERLLKRAHGH